MKKELNISNLITALSPSSADDNNTTRRYDAFSFS
jgi:hypothetical protein